MFRLDGKVAVITGGASGIGRAIATSFADAGAVVHIVEVDKTSAEQTVGEIQKRGGSAKWHLCDV
ncbi:MAG: SDR family NAD(P)-dependent oxidoreductase, partial [Acidobacteria bacterium]|nr:SDR family NAD(P)-dependent oxidoreductase [Acidobacteriota bacterium]